MRVTCHDGSRTLVTGGCTSFQAVSHEVLPFALRALPEPDDQVKFVSALFDAVQRHCLTGKQVTLTQPPVTITIKPDA
jgi:hypothetical protein